MKRILCLLMMLCLWGMGCGALAANLKEVYCREREFTTRIPETASTEWDEDVFYIYLDKPGYVPNIFILRRSQEEKIKDPERYVKETYPKHMKEKHGGQLVAYSTMEYYDIGGKRLYASSYIYRNNSGYSINQLVLVEPREDGDVEYVVRYPNSDRERTLEAADGIVRYYQPDGQPGSGIAASSSGALQDVICTDQNYTTKMPAGLSAEWRGSNGMRIWLEDPGYVPNVRIWRRTAKLSDPEKYVKTTYGEEMQSSFNGGLRSVTYYGNYSIGGKTLLAHTYVYKDSHGTDINLLHAVEVREDRDVEYTARYLDSEREKTLAVLDTVVRYYTPTDTGNGKASGSIASGKQSTAGTKELKAQKVKPILSGTSSYSDGRFSMTLPSGWNIMTQSDYMSFCLRSWDPKAADRQIFFFMKLEPFLKSQTAKNKYLEVNNSFGGNTIYQYFAYAPVMKSNSLKGFLDALPDTKDFCARYYRSGMTISPNVIPYMKNVEILEKKKSTLPAPGGCGENVIARISYTGEQGGRCEGMVTAQPTEQLAYDFLGTDGWMYTVYLFMGVTAPAGEMPELEETLLDCLSSFAFKQSYVNQAVDISTSQKNALLAQARTMQAAHDSMVSAWYAREQAHDISFQKWSDAFNGYDRLYDSATGEIYLADVGFYDSYNLNRSDYKNPNLQIVDSSTEKYYLQAADYYITK